MKVGDLVVHIGAKPNGYRVRLVCDFGIKYAKSSRNSLIADKVIIFFVDGRHDWKDQWRVFTGWEGYESR